MKHGIYWLASYPKSGNTWVRTLITNYMLDGNEPANINALQTDFMASDRKLFEELLCLPSSDMNEEQIRLYQPLMYKELLRDAARDYFIKVHDSYILNHKGKPLFPSSITKGVVYIVRNPLDVTVSYKHHTGGSADYEVINEEDYTLDALGKGLKNQLPQLLQSWSSHVSSWIGSGLPVHVVRYEDMLSSPYETFSGVLEFLGFGIEEARLRKALEFSSFETLKKQEELYGFVEKHPKAASFFRKGESGSYKKILTKEQIESIRTYNETLMKRFGYY